MHDRCSEHLPWRTWNQDPLGNPVQDTLGQIPGVPCMWCGLGFLSLAGEILCYPRPGILSFLLGRKASRVGVPGTADTFSCFYAANTASAAKDTRQRQRQRQMKKSKGKEREFRAGGCSKRKMGEGQTGIEMGLWSIEDPASFQTENKESCCRRRTKRNLLISGGK